MTSRARSQKGQGGPTKGRDSILTGEASLVDAAPSDDDIRAALRALLDDARFSASERNRRFLAYVVEEELQGRGPQIRAYGVAVEAFRRPADFNPELDPIVRIEASRLRRALDSYYSEHPDVAELHIAMPKGSYRPIFTGVPSAPVVAAETVAPPRKWPLLVVMSAALATLLVLAVGHWWRSGLTGRPSGDAVAPAILIAPLDALDADPETHRLANGLTRDLVDRLLRFRTFDIYGSALYANARDIAAVDFTGLADRVHADYIVEGAMRRVDSRFVISIQLRHRPSGRYVWTYRAESPAGGIDVVTSMFDVAGQIAGALGQPYGVINRSEWLKRQPSSADAYFCVLQAHEYYRSIDPAGHAKARDCLEQAVAADPDYAAAWVMLAWVYLDEVRYRLNPRPDLYDAEAMATSAVNRALTLDPDLEMGLSARSVLQFRAGDMDGFRATGARMIAMNPNDPDLAADFGARLALSGDWQTGVPLVRRALELAVEPPGTYHMVMAWDLYRRSDYQAALLEAEKIRMPEFQLAVLTCAAIFGQLGMKAEAQQEVTMLRALRPDLAEDPRQWLAELHFEPAFAQGLADGLRKARELAGVT